MGSMDASCRGLLWAAELVPLPTTAGSCCGSSLRVPEDGRRDLPVGPSSLAREPVGRSPTPPGTWSRDPVALKSSPRVHESHEPGADLGADACGMEALFPDQSCARQKNKKPRSHHDGGARLLAGSGYCGDWWRVKEHVAAARRGRHSSRMTPGGSRVPDALTTSTNCL